MAVIGCGGNGTHSGWLCKTEGKGSGGDHHGSIGSQCIGIRLHGRQSQKEVISVAVSCHLPQPCYQAHGRSHCLRDSHFSKIKEAIINYDTSLWHEIYSIRFLSHQRKLLQRLVMREGVVNKRVNFVMHLSACNRPINERMKLTFSHPSDLHSSSSSRGHHHICIHVFCKAALLEVAHP